MNWVDSKSCTPLKRDFLREWFAKEQRFFLTGGSALGLFYLDHRRSYDLDLFTTEPVLSDFGDREGRAFAFLMQGAGMVAFLGAASKQPEADQ